MTGRSLLSNIGIDFWKNLNLYKIWRKSCSKNSKMLLLFLNLTGGKRLKYCAVITNSLRTFVSHNFTPVNFAPWKCSPKEILPPHDFSGMMFCREITFSLMILLKKSIILLSSSNIWILFILYFLSTTQTTALIENNTLLF